MFIHFSFFFVFCFFFFLMFFCELYIFLILLFFYSFFCTYSMYIWYPLFPFMFFLIHIFWSIIQKYCDRMEIGRSSLTKHVILVSSYIWEMMIAFCGWNLSIHLKWCKCTKCVHKSLSIQCEPKALAVCIQILYQTYQNSSVLFCTSATINNKCN